MSLAYQSDYTVDLETPDGTVKVHLAGGGEKFPWAVLEGRVVIGPPDGTLTSDGKSMEDLKWTVDPLWVIEAINLSGDSVELSPEEHSEAIRQALEHGQ
jgi:hypothetical protein